MNKSEATEILQNFNINDDIIEISYFSNGLINTTCKLSTDKNEHYVLQKINKNVFKNPEHVMENIANVTHHIKKTLQKNNKNSSRKVLTFLTTIDGKSFYIDENHDYWRLYNYIENSTAYDQPEDLTTIERAGEAFGDFQNYLSNFPAKNLHIIIPHFHNTQNRYELFKEAIKNNLANRFILAEDEVFSYLELEDIATQMYQKQKEGKLSLRVTHNDTKCNNVLFDKTTKKPLCVVDLDTVMPGLIGFDFGDAIRSIANTTNEDETDLSKVKLDLEKYEAFAKGFIKKTANVLTEEELKTLPLGAITMTLECGLRFLTDYLNGDTYFKTCYENHNLDRARCQLKLGLDMIKKYETMQDIVNSIHQETLDSEKNTQ